MGARAIPLSAAEQIAYYGRSHDRHHAARVRRRSPVRLAPRFSDIRVDRGARRLSALAAAASWRARLSRECHRPLQGEKHVPGGEPARIRGAGLPALHGHLRDEYPRRRRQCRDRRRCPGQPPVRHLVAGQSTTCAGKVHAMIAAVAADRRSEVFLFGDSDLQPDPDWAREMARPFLDPGVSVVTSHRWVQAEERGLAPSLYTVLSGHYCIYLATPFLAVVWGGAFGISRKAYDEMGIEEVWSTTASDDVALGNRMAELRVRPFYVPRGVCTEPGDPPQSRRDEEMVRSAGPQREDPPVPHVARRSVRGEPRLSRPARVPRAPGRGGGRRLIRRLCPRGSRDRVSPSRPAR